MGTPLQSLIYLALCALLGATGQAARTIVGLKKLRDDAAAKGVPFSQCFSPGELVISLLIGGVAGVLAGLAIQQDATTTTDHKFAIGIMGAGYAGADFIEGFMKREGSPGAGTPPAAADKDPADVPPVG